MTLESTGLDVIEEKNEAPVILKGEVSRMPAWGPVRVLLTVTGLILVQNLLSALHVNAYWLQVAYGAMLIVGSVIGAQLAAPRRAGTA